MVFFTIQLPPNCTLFPYTTLFRSGLRRAAGRPGHRPRRRLRLRREGAARVAGGPGPRLALRRARPLLPDEARAPGRRHPRSEEHTSELQSLTNLVCRLLLEKKKNE